MTTAVTCMEPGCPDAAKVRGRCQRHYRAWWGDPDNADSIDRYGRDPLERFLSKVDVGLCWQFSSTDRQGYGQFHHAGRNHLAHRWLWQQLVGPIPEGLELDHLCRVPGCVNPDHLEPVTHQVNVHRGLRGPQRFCAKGHELTPENCAPNTRGIRCRTCQRAYQRAYQRDYKRRRRAANREEPP